MRSYKTSISIFSESPELSEVHFVYSSCNEASELTTAQAVRPELFFRYTYYYANSVPIFNFFMIILREKSYFSILQRYKKFFFFINIFWNLPDLGENS
jgi:hypothetical protein